MSKIEKDFAEIQAKMDQAAQLIREANKLALASDKALCLYDLIYESDEDALSNSELYSALNNAGWSTSSMGC